jgi:16S rRNA (adenine1518-N6/adenine1519-N6)-dimethyltransferase
MARQRLGQHFLGAPGWQKKIFSTLPVGREDVWIEIGPGHGEMTRHLAAHARRLIAIEADTRLFTELQENVARRPTDWPGVEIARGDVLEQDLAKLAGGERFRVYGNLPYYITSPILQQTLRSRVPRAVFLIQKEVAERLVAQPGNRAYGFLTVETALFATARLLFEVKPAAFHPPPKVDSAVVLLEPHGRDWGVDTDGLLRFVGRSFAHKRKTLRNNLAEFYGNPLVDLWPEAGLRAEQLSIDDFVRMYARIAASGGDTK